MKYLLLGAAITLFGATACNNETKQSINDADSANEAKGTVDSDSLSNPNTINVDSTARVATDENGSAFLVRAAAGGLTEVEIGRMGETKATSLDVKRFATAMVHDHTIANKKIDELASARTVTLPMPVATNKEEKLSQLAGNKFDREFMDKMVKDHKETIDLFEKYSDKTKDDSIRSFIQQTLPILRMHLDTAQAIKKLVNRAK